MTTTDDDLAGVARAGLEAVPDFEGGPMEPTLDGMEYSNLKFNGMGYQTQTKDLNLGDVHEFTVSARVVGVGDRLMKDMQIQHVITMDVIGVAMLGDPNPVTGGE
jgi:hypothetical protein